MCDPVARGDSPFPVAAANCPSGFGYFVMTQSGAVLFAEQAFTGGTPSSESLTLGGARAARRRAWPQLRMLMADSFLAVPSPGQIAVYLRRLFLMVVRLTGNATPVFSPLLGVARRFSRN